MSRINKFSLPWQIVRVKARTIKDVHRKIAYVTTFLREHPNAHNYERVMNWLKMTQVAYKGEQRDAFDLPIKTISSHRDSAYSSPADTPSDPENFSTADINLVLKDLAKRKYGFQFASTPKDHTDFVAVLQKELDERAKHGK